MNKYLLVFASIFTSILGHAQVPSIEWQNCFGGSNDDRSNAIVQTMDGGYIVGAHTFSTDGDVTLNNGQYDCWVIKLNSAGVIEWQKSYGGTDLDEIYSIIQSRDGGYVFAGVTGSQDGDVTPAHAGYEGWVVKLDSAGSIIWQKTYGGSLNEMAYHIIQTTDGGYAFAGSAESGDGDLTSHHGSLMDLWAVKLDSAGTMQWQKSMGGSEYDFGGSIAQAPDNGFILGGYTASVDGEVTGQHGTNNTQDSWIVKLDSAGVVEWHRTLGGPGDERATAVVVAADSGYVIAGYTNSTSGDVSGNHGGSDYWLIKLNTNGTIQWQRCYGGSGNDQAECMSKTNDGGYVLSGVAVSSNGDVTNYHGNGDVWVVKVNSAGTLLWQRCFGGNGVDWANGIIQNNNSGYAIAGVSDSTSYDVSGIHGWWDAWIVKLGPDTGACRAFFSIIPDANTPHQWLLYNQSSGAQPVTYVWNWGDGSIDTAATPTHTFNSPNDYNICLSISDAAGCTATFCDSSRYIYKNEGAAITVNVIDATILGIADNNRPDLLFSIFPNPSGNFVNVQVNEALTGGLLTVTDLTGTIIESLQLQKKSTVLQTNNLSSGIYFLSITTLGETTTRKLIVQN